MKTINRNDPCIHGDPGMCDDCYAGSKLKRRIEHMKTETKHTPTPWKVGGKDVNGLTRIRLDDETIGRIGKYQDAAFIVRAVNAHDELLAFAYKIKNATMLSKKWNELAEQAITRAQEPKP